MTKRSPTPANPPADTPSPRSDRGEGTKSQSQAQSQTAPEAQTIIEVDPALTTEDDESYESDAVSNASTSISSSVRDYAFENNRRYHKYQEGRYHFPNDEPEQEREDMKHAMIIHLCGGKLHYAPLENPQSILDIGTGTGIWAVDMGDEYPEADVLGIDLSPIQPLWVPPNVRFMVDDAEAEWLQPPNSLDFIHIRHMCSSIRDWPKLLSHAYKALKPGGWIEMQELRFISMCDDDSMPENHIVAQFLNNVKAGLAVFGVNLLAMEKNAQMLRDAEFANVEEKVFKVPLGTWPKDENMKKIGLYNRSMIYDGLHGISMGPFTRGLKWSPEEVNTFLIDVRKGLMDSTAHIYIPFHIVMGQKPADDVA